MQFIEIDLGSIQPVYGVVTKGRSGHLEWVKAYKVLYSRDGTVYTYIKDAGTPNEEKVRTFITISWWDVFILFLRNWISKRFLFFTLYIYT